MHPRSHNLLSSSPGVLRQYLASHIDIEFDGSSAVWDCILGQICQHYERESSLDAIRTLQLLLNDFESGILPESLRPSHSTLDVFFDLSMKNSEMMGTSEDLLVRLCRYHGTLIRCRCGRLEKC